MSDAPLCVYCRQRPVERRWRPFCSERCKMADLGRWLSDGYSVPVPPAEEMPDIEPADATKDDPDAT